MTNITIPPEALEKAASAYTASIYKSNASMAEFHKAIHAAALALLENWPGAEVHNFDGWTHAEGYVLPLPQETE